MATHGSTFQLLNGRQMPMIGFGTFRINGRETIVKVIDAALKSGYRAIDTAAVYHNEEDIGWALKTLLPKYGLTREDIFITTKLAPGVYGRERINAAVQKSISSLGVSYLDLYLIHWPGSAGLPMESPDNAKIRTGIWSELVALHRRGLLRAIGVSNYTPRHISELVANCEGVKPAVNQVECHPHFRQSELVGLCQGLGILVQAYSSMGGTGQRSLVDDPEVRSVATAVRRSPAQVLLRWALERGIAIIPKSVTPQRIAENIDLDFVLSPQDMHVLNNISRTEKYAWNPDKVY